MDVQNFHKVPSWIPKENSGSLMKIFMRRIEEKYNTTFADYFEFYKWSVDNIPQLWAEIWEYSGVICSKTYNEVIDLNIPMEDSPKWFEGAKLNFAENLLKHRDDNIALVATGEGRTDVERLTFKQLYKEVKLYAAALRKIGLKKGDRVACYMSNRKEAVIAMIAVTSIGAIWTAVIPLLGSQAYLNRVKQVSPKILITIDQIPHSGEVINLLPNIKAISEGLPSLEKVIIVAAKPESKLKCISDIYHSVFLDNFLESAYEADGSVPDLKFEQLSFSHPVFISYTSGTTGLPKTIVHGFGALFPGLRDLWLHWNGQRDDRWLSMSPAGWVSWNILNNILFVGETLVLYEGSPYFLSPTYFWDLVDNLKLTRVFMTTPVLDEFEFKEYLPTAKHDLSSLNMILSAGSVVKPHNYDFALKKVKADVMFGNGYGCTEIMGFCIVSESILPTYSGEISAVSLGVAIECLDESGNPVEGKMGEFIISKPMPNLPLGLWEDTDGKVLKRSYFSKFPGKFAIGDTIIINPVTKGIITCGRSDETLKPRGWRFGSSEIYNVVEQFPDVKDSLCVAQFSKSMDERAVLFIKMQKGYVFNQELVKRLKHNIADELSTGHVPAVMLEVPDIPRNVTGKKMEIIVKKIINNMPYNAETVSNAECLNFYSNIPELQGY